MQKTQQMDNIYFYIEKQSYRAALQKIKFNYQRKCNISILIERNLLFAKMKKTPNALLYFIKEKISQDDKILIHTLRSQIRNLKVCLYSSKQFALDAWQMDLLDFKPFPITPRHVLKTYHKYVNSSNQLKEYLVLKLHDGRHKIPFKNINYFKADGNYTNIYLNSGRKITVTKQLHIFERLTAHDYFINRMNRSYIINTANIRFIGKGRVAFYGGDCVLNDISRTLENSIKKEIIE